MAKKKGKGKKTLPEIDAIEAKTLILSLGTIINNSLHQYWLSQTDMTNATIECYALLTSILDKCPMVSSTIIDKTLTVNGAAIDQSNPNIRALIDHLIGLEIENFTLEHGISEADFGKMIEIFDARPFEIEQLGGFGALLEEFKIQHVTTRKVVLKEVGEEEVVVSKDELEGEEGGGEGPGEKTVGNILAFLKGDISTENKEAVKDVQDVASNADKMAELIMQAAAVNQQETPIEEGETLVDFVVGCMKRTYNGMKKDSGYKTKIGKKRITKNLLLLEEEIVKRMREMSEEWTDADFESITEATHDMTEEMQMDSLADEYMNKYVSVKESEEKVLDYLRAHGIENIDDAKLKEKLEERGLETQGWQELVIKSGGPGAGAGAGPGDGAGEGAAKGAGPGAGPGGGTGAAAGAGTGAGAGAGAGAAAGAGAGIGGGWDLGGGMGSVLDAVTQLDHLLDHMEKQFDKVSEGARDKNARRMVNVLKTVDKQIGVLAADTEQKIQSLLEGLETDEAAVETAEAQLAESGKPLMVTRNNMLKTITDIAANIREPLALIKTSIDMISSKTLGGINEDQMSVLELALKNASIINDLLIELKKLSG